jgi:hypothetical protein
MEASPFDSGIVEAVSLHADVGEWRTRSCVYPGEVAMKRKMIMLAVLAVLPSAAIAQDCSTIKDRFRRAKCDAGVETSRAYAEEAKAWNRAARLRDMVCVADSVGAATAAKAAGFKGRIVYKGTREAANLITNGASRC